MGPHSSKPLLAAALLLASSAVQADDPPPPAPLAVHRTTAAIVVDGKLNDPGWEGAAVIDRFYETQPGDNLEPKARTKALVTYDDRYLYIGLVCQDPDPSRIRAPFVERDNVIGTDDNVAIFLDPRNDRRWAVELRVNPRGIQGDAIFNDADDSEDFSPDFLYDSAAQITKEGWVAELRVPFSSLRYPAADPQDWGILIWRNYPREYRYFIHSVPIPRGSNCLICKLAPLTGFTGLPRAASLLVVPYGTAQAVSTAGAPGEDLGPADKEADAGVDVKWTPTANTAVDLTVNPDFSQVEADVAQITANERFAIFFPEKRPFFLEGVDLLSTPIPAVYTRTITSPRGGLRITGKSGASSYTVLASQDRGGGLVILPGATSSDYVPQDFRSWVGIGRVRRDFGNSFGGLLFTGRDVEGTGHNVVVGPDFQWRGSNDRLTGQVLLSDTRTPDRPDLATEWDGRHLTSGAGRLSYAHSTSRVEWNLEYKDFGSGFRADAGFVPQVGFRQLLAANGWNFYPQGFFRQIRPFVSGTYAEDRDRRSINEVVNPGVFLIGVRNLTSELDFYSESFRVGAALLHRNYGTGFVQFDPGRIVSRVNLTARLGEDIDVENAREGTGGSVQASATIRPDPHLQLDAISDLRWLDVLGGRLFTAQVQRLKATLSFGPRAFLRVIGQYVSTTRDPALYLFPVSGKDAGFDGSALFSYRLNWQTALFVGYGDNRVLDEHEDLVPVERQFFMKVSYAIQK